MSYIVKRYTHGLKRYKAWFLLSFLMPGLYLLSAACAPDRHAVWQDIRLPLETPFTSASFNTITEVVSAQAIFFRDNFDVNRYFNLSAINIEQLETKRYRQVTSAISNDITLTYQGGIARIRYLGKDAELGTNLVDYYARRLVRKAREGIEISGMHLPSERLPERIGAIESTALRAIWRPDRLVPLLILLTASVLAVMALVAALEWNDAALKSERQIARYVNLPVLGSLPDLNRVSRVLGEKPPLNSADTRS
ncbi:hypothetical protein [Desulfoluna spongiiphila]|uniref:hypothetical protein n=1 Tax=Desulfoluna spongiiphila TaxID=419481 RepID=UPI0012512CBE|nr:hypothetical protein [Desulfoluna spongiiphila]VVS94372.1 prokaryotic membrane lipoprotein lipid attachment site profile [Desulfoluna spongiiphila]